MRRRSFRQGRIWIGVLISATVLSASAGAQAPAGRARVDTATPDSTGTEDADQPLRIVVHLADRSLVIRNGKGVVRQYQVAIGQSKYPTPHGEFLIRRIVWNPSWTPPPDAKWAKNQTPKEPGHPENPMKLVKIFFREPDYYIHGTDDVESLGTAASHGCLRMDPYDAADVAKYLMDHGGQPRGESWFWRVIHMGREEKEIYLKRPIPIVIAE